MLRLTIPLRSTFYGLSPYKYITSNSIVCYYPKSLPIPRWRIVSKFSYDHKDFEKSSFKDILTKEVCREYNDAEDCKRDFDKLVELTLKAKYKKD